MTRDYDPRAPFVAQDLLEYPDLGAYFRGEPCGNTRNGNIRHYQQYPGPAWAADYAEGFDACAAGRHNIGPSPLFARCHDAGFDFADRYVIAEALRRAADNAGAAIDQRQATRAAERAGQPDPFAAPAAAVHPAPQP